MMECAARIKPGFLPQSIIFLSQALGQLPWGPGFGLCAPRRAATPWFLSCAARFEGRNFLKKVSSKTFSRLRAFGPAARTRFYLSLRRGFQPPPQGASCSAGAPAASGPLALRRTRRDFTPLRGSLLRRTVYTRLRRCTRSTPGGCCRPCRFCGRPKASPASPCGKTSGRSPPKTPP